MKKYDSQGSALNDRQTLPTACLNSHVARLLSRGPVVTSAFLTWVLSYLAGASIWLAQSFFDFPSEFFSGPSPQIRRLDLATRLFVGSLVAPLVETFIFQWLPIRLICRVFKASASLAVCASTLAFGTVHGYGPVYVAVALWGGFIFATVFALRDYPGGRPFLVVASAHAARNTLASIII
ncbi:CPBP family glutamic-type intramembrane protease [Burkholderia sp. BCC1047]|uniref:CPBP family glutamic-type intramembrane protease n=1 Tax=Burkholderia sp. BCC1047 TaxID=2676299 RepID=UPI00158F53D9|nr:CPBP family glutamic-type intramembrane protease [Burkholderia sp. BCC1047]